MRKIRVLWAQTHPTQYVTPLLKLISIEKNINLTACYLSDFSINNYYDVQFKREIKWDIDLLSGYKSFFLSRSRKNIKFSFFCPYIFISFRLVKEIFCSDIIIVQGWQHYYLLIIGLVARIFGKTVVQRSETPSSIKIDNSRVAFKKSYFHWILSTLSFAFSNYYLYIGELNKRYLLSRSISKNKLFKSPYCVDNSFFIDLINAEKPVIARKFDIDISKPTLLYSSKLTHRKNVILLLEMFIKYFYNNANLVIVGDGPLKSEVINIINSNNNLSNIHFLGFINQKELPNLYHLADIFVLPAFEENWGVVINEAMCNSCAIITTNEVGSSYDLVQHKVNGYIYDTKYQNKLFSALEFCLYENRYKNMGLESKRIISDWDNSITVKSIISISNEIA